MTGPVWSPSSNNNFHISNTLTHISTHFFTHTYFKKFQKTPNNNSQTHLPNGPVQRFSKIERMNLGSNIAL